MKRLQTVWADLIGPALGTGKIIESEAWRFLGQLAATAPAFVRKAYLDHMLPNYYAIGGMHDLRSRGVRLVLVANYRSWVETLGRRYPWLGAFKETCLSSDHRAARHHSLFIEALRRQCGDDFIFIEGDENVAHVLQERGVDTVLAKGLWMNEVWGKLERGGGAASRPKYRAPSVPYSALGAG